MQNAELVLSRLVPCQPDQNLAGQKFHKLTAVECAGKNKWGQSFWKCSCECGGSFITQSWYLKKGLAKSCGCIKAAAAYANSPRKHCYSRSSDPEKKRLYYVWVGMRNRCENVNRKEYPFYGGAGIKVCPEWASFENFLRDMGPRPTPKHTIDRWPDKGGNYEKKNCRWALMIQQQNNRKNNLVISITGNSMTISQMCAILGGCRHKGAVAYHRAKKANLPCFLWRGTQITILPKS